MIAEEISLVMSKLELNRAALTTLLSVSRKTLYRWEHGGAGEGATHPALVILHVIADRITQQPLCVAHLRAFAHMSVARGGLPHFVDRCLTSHLNADQKG